MTALCLAMSRHHKLLLQGEPSPARRRLLRVLAPVGFALALLLCMQRLGGEIGAVVWLCQLMLAGVLLVGLLAWKARWVFPLAAVLPLAGSFTLLL
ncbi:hypothetical protein D9M68_975710 [compost metagenome]